MRLAERAVKAAAHSGSLPLGGAVSGLTAGTVAAPRRRVKAQGLKPFG